MVPNPLIRRGGGRVKHVKEARVLTDINCDDYRVCLDEFDCTFKVGVFPSHRRGSGDF